MKLKFSHSEDSQPTNQLTDRPTNQLTNQLSLFLKCTLTCLLLLLYGISTEPTRILIIQSMKIIKRTIVIQTQQ